MNRSFWSDIYWRFRNCTAIVGPLDSLFQEPVEKDRKSNWITKRKKRGQNLVKVVTTPTISSISLFFLFSSLLEVERGPKKWHYLKNKHFPLLCVGSRLSYPIKALEFWRGRETRRRGKRDAFLRRASIQER